MSSTSEPKDLRILIAINDDDQRRRLEELLRSSELGFEVIKPEIDPLLEAPETTADLVVVRRCAAQPQDLSLVDAYTREKSAPRLVVLRDEAGEGSISRARLLAAGASGILEVADTNRELRRTIEAIAGAGAPAGDGPARTGRPEMRPRLSDFLSRSPRMRRFLELVHRVADTESSLLLTGETGVGKEWLAQAIHNEGPRGGGPFVSVNCGALPEPLLESELFGHEAGAFTGASRRKKGRFEMADGGTIFLDEVAEMPVHLQVSLLTVLQRRMVQRVGSEELVPVDIRVMAATNRTVEEEVERGRFREDLYYRLNVVNLEIPPLRERTEDIPELVGTYVRHFRSALGRRDVESISDEALQAMMHYPWPGNVRELVNAVEHAIVLCSSSRISVSDLPDTVTGVPHAAQRVAAASAEQPATNESGGTSASLRDEWLNLPLREARRAVSAEFERGYLDALLRATGGKVGATAQRAGISTRSLYEKMRRHELRKEDYR